MIFNLNVGILGHIDSGKTSLAKVLSEVGSTASFDKNPQSQERGITLDLGFSSFTIDIPEQLKSRIEYEKLQFTLVDCPGHASLIRTIIGGSQIIDFILLVIDITKGIQTQTAECIVIGELTCKKMIVVLNKLDLIEKSKLNKTIEKMTKKIKSVLSTTVFKDSEIVCISTRSEPEEYFSNGIKSLISSMSNIAYIPERNNSLPFIFAVDHCFAIKGQGTIMTGTVLQGTVCINDDIEIPSVKLVKKVKSIQMFKNPVKIASQGDRIGICVTQFDPKLMERGIISEPKLINAISCCIIDIHKIQYFKGNIHSKSKFHISIGHETVMGRIKLFTSSNQNDNFDYNLEYLYEDSFLDSELENKKYHALIEFENPVLAVPNTLIIGSKLDMDINTSACRIAFWGHLKEFCTDKDNAILFQQKIKIYKNKSKIGILDRVVNKHEIIVKNLFKKETNIQIFVGLQVLLSTGEKGKIEGTFGQSGKVKVYVSEGLKTETVEKTNIKNKTEKENVSVFLDFKKFVHDPLKKIGQ